MSHSTTNNSFTYGDQSHTSRPGSPIDQLRAEELKKQLNLAAFNTGLHPNDFAARHLAR